MPYIIAIDGRAAAGKTTMAKKLAKEFNAAVVHTDDFYLPFNRRTADKSHMDLNRLETEILRPAAQGENISFKPYDCSAAKYKKSVKIKPGKILIIEGSYSLHPSLQKYYDLKIFLAIFPRGQARRIKERDRQKALAFFKKWIPAEEKYLKKYKIKQSADIILKST